MNTVHNFSVKEINGTTKNLADYKGKVLLIVNTASKCGFTKQFADLEKLYQDYKNQDFEILGFPCNQFKQQEPLNGNAITEFCTVNYGVTFKMFDKIDVKGATAIPLYQYLSKKSINGKFNSTPLWNFHKYLVDKNGKVVNYYLMLTNPNAKKVTKAIDKLLAL